MNQADKMNYLLSKQKSNFISYPWWAKVFFDCETLSHKKHFKFKVNFYNKLQIKMASRNTENYKKLTELSKNGKQLRMSKTYLYVISLKFVCLFDLNPENYGSLTTLSKHPIVTQKVIKTYHLKKIRNHKCYKSLAVSLTNIFCLSSMNFKLCSFAWSEWEKRKKY